MSVLPQVKTLYMDEINANIFTGFTIILLIQHSHIFVRTPSVSPNRPKAPKSLPSGDIASCTIQRPLVLGAFDYVETET